MARLMQQVGSSRLRVNLDIGHAQVTDDDLAATIRQLGSAIVHLHLEDIKGRVHRHLPFGEGDIDFAAVRRALDEIGYAGPYVVDLFGQSAEPPVVAERALAALRQYFA
jgi:sugar phosphate isomerase/epimerase